MRLKVIYREMGRDELSDIRHSHDNELELVHVLSGVGKLFVGDRVIPFVGEAVFFIDGAMLHYICPEEGTPYVRSKLILGKELLGTLLPELLADGYLYRTPSPELSVEADRAFLSLSAQLEGKREPLLLLSRVMELLHLCTVQMDEGGTHYHGMVADVVSLVHERLEEGISLAEVADTLHVNKHYLCRLFKRETGMTVGAYINSARIAKAKQLLRTAECSVGAVADGSGFNEPSVFTKAFKKEVGMTPTEYRAYVRAQGPQGGNTWKF